MFKIGDIVRIIASKPDPEDENDISAYINFVGTIIYYNAGYRYPYTLKNGLGLMLCCNEKEIALVDEDIKLSKEEVILQRINKLYSKCSTTSKWYKPNYLS